MNALIYIVDDEPTVCGVTRRMLEQAGYTVQTMHTARRLLPRCVPNRRDLVLLDVALPDGDGLDLCRQLKSNPATAQVPIVIVSGWCIPGMYEEAVAAGASCVLSKPFSLHELHDCVAQNLTRNGRRTN